MASIFFLPTQQSFFAPPLFLGLLLALEQVSYARNTYTLVKKNNYNTEKNDKIHVSVVISSIILSSRVVKS